MPISVAIVEDNRDLREGLSQLIKGTPGYSCVGSYGSCDQMLSGVKQAKPEVVLMDIGLPGMSGIEGVQKLKQLLPGVEVLMLTVFEDEQKIFDSIVAGASGYLLKKISPTKLLEAIREVAAGGAPMTARIARRVLEAFQKGDPQKNDRVDLSERERQVLSGLVNGMTYQAIADQLFISIDTVRSHVKSIYDKLHVNSKAQAITLAMKNRLV